MSVERPKQSRNFGRRPKQQVDSPTQIEVEAAMRALIDAVVPQKAPRPARPKAVRKTGAAANKTPPKR